MLTVLEGVGRLEEREKEEEREGGGERRGVWTEQSYCCYFSYMSSYMSVPGSKLSYLSITVLIYVTEVCIEPSVGTEGIAW